MSNIFLNLKRKTELLGHLNLRWLCATYWCFLPPPLVPLPRKQPLCLLPIQLEQKSHTGGIVEEGCFTIELIHSGIKGGVRFGEYRKSAE